MQVNLNEIVCRFIIYRGRRSLPRLIVSSLVMLLLRRWDWLLRLLIKGHTVISRVDHHDRGSLGNTAMLRYVGTCNTLSWVFAYALLPLSLDGPLTFWRVTVEAILVLAFHSSFEDHRLRLLDWSDRLPSVTNWVVTLKVDIESVLERFFVILAQPVVVSDGFSYHACRLIWRHWGQVAKSSCRLWLKAAFLVD